MKVLMINGSPNKKGCTYTALSAVGAALNAEGVDYEIYNVGQKPLRSCQACGVCRSKKNGLCVFADDCVNEVIEKLGEADGFILGSPVHYAAPSGAILSVMGRVGYAAAEKVLRNKPGAAVVSARRAGTTAALDALNKFLGYYAYPQVNSTYWCMVHGAKAEDVLEDKEGLQIMHNLGLNMAHALKTAALAKENGLEYPRLERAAQTNFIR